MTERRRTDAHGALPRLGAAAKSLGAALFLLLAGSLASVPLTPAPAYGQTPMVTVIEHQGSTDPLTEGWPEGGFGFAVFDDLGSGFDAWATVDSNSGGGGDAYLLQLSDETIAQGNTYGWRLSARLRVVEVPETPNPDQPGGSPALLYRDGSRTWQLHFGPSSITFLTKVTTPGGVVLEEIAIPAAGANTSHRLYELAYDPGSQTADVYIDGVEVLSNVQGAPFGSGFPIPKSVFFGSASSSDVGQGNYSFVRFEVGAPPVPVMTPSGIVILAGLLGSLGTRRLVG